jgi:hypothetical protein
MAAPVPPEQMDAMLRAQAEWQSGMLECAIRQTEFLQVIAESQQASLVALAELRALLIVEHPPEEGATEGEAESVAELLHGLAEDIAEAATAAGFLSEDPAG